MVVAVVVVCWWGRGQDGGKESRGEASMSAWGACGGGEGGRWRAWGWRCGGWGGGGGGEEIQNNNRTRINIVLFLALVASVTFYTERVFTQSSRSRPRLKIEG